MKTRVALAKSLKRIREVRDLTQEDFSEVSSRVYISQLERGMKNPTLEKISQLSEVMEIHPLTLVALTYLMADKRLDLDGLLERVRGEVDEILDH